MPTCLVLTLLTMQPRLQAEDSILAANRIAVGGGKLQKQSADQIAREWAETAGIPASAPPSKPAGPPPGVSVKRHKRTKA